MASLLKIVHLALLAYVPSPHCAMSRQRGCSTKTANDVFNALQNLPSSVLSSITNGNGSVEEVVVELGEGLRAMDAKGTFTPNILLRGLFFFSFTLCTKQG